MKHFLNLSNLIPLFLAIFVIKTQIVATNFYDFGIIGFMTLAFIHKLRLDNTSVSESEELKAIISQLEENVNESLVEIRKRQDDDKVANDSKFSTLNLGLQRQPKSNEKQTFKWGS